MKGNDFHCYALQKNYTNYKDYFQNQFQDIS